METLIQDVFTLGHSLNRNQFKTAQSSCSAHSQERHIGAGLVYVHECCAVCESFSTGRVTTSPAIVSFSYHNCML